MVRRNTIFQNPKSIAATVLIGLGILILFANLAQASSQVSHFLGSAIENADTPSVLTTAGLLAGRAVQAYLFDHTEFLRGFHQILISFSALLLIVTGTVFFAVIFAAGGESQKKEEGMSISLPLIRRIAGSKTQPRTSNRKHCC